MGWIKAELDDTTHETIRREAEKSGSPIHEVAGQLLRERLETTDTFAEVTADG